MTKLQEELLKACKALGITIELNYVVLLKDGRKVKTSVRLPSLGGKNGMLIVTSCDEFYSIYDDPIGQDYGIATLEEPRDSSEFNLDACMEMFRDWGWVG